MNICTRLQPAISLVVQIIDKENLNIRKNLFKFVDSAEYEAKIACRYSCLPHIFKLLITCPCKILQVDLVIGCYLGNVGSNSCELN